MRDQVEISLFVQVSNYTFCNVLNLDTHDLCADIPPWKLSRRKNYPSSFFTSGSDTDLQKKGNLGPFSGDYRKSSELKHIMSALNSIPSEAPNHARLHPLKGVLPRDLSTSISSNRLGTSYKYQ